MVARIAPGSTQLLVGPASAGSVEQMNVRSSTRATSVGSVRAQKEFGLRRSSSRTSVPAATSSSVRRVHSSGDPSHQTTRSGVVSAATSLTQASRRAWERSEEHTSELQSRENLVCRLLLEKKKNK